MPPEATSSYTGRCGRLTESPYDDVTGSCAGQGNLDAIFIPTSRPSALLRRQLASFASVARHVFILTSGDATFWLKTEGLPSNVRIIPLSPTNEEWLLSVSSSKNPTALIDHTYDLPAKRNLALAIAAASRFERIALLDDDIVIKAAQMREACAVVSKEFPLAGYYALEFGDVGTIERLAQREFGTSSAQTMPGGNCLFLFLPAVTGFFPYIYNEDWLFAFSNLTCRRGVALGSVRQLPHTPWRNLRRVRFEEFGEVIITGVLRCRGIENHDLLTLPFWNDIIATRAADLRQLNEAASDLESRLAVRAAADTLNKLVSGRSCVDFIEHFLHDLEAQLCPTTIPIFQ